MSTSSVPHRVRTAAVVAALALSACFDSPTAIDRGETSGTLLFPEETVAAVFAITPAGSVDSVAVGAASGLPGAYVVSVPVANQVLVYDSTGVIKPQVRFRLFIAADADHEAVRLAPVSAVRRVVAPDQSTTDITFEERDATAIRVLIDR